MCCLGFCEDSRFGIDIGNRKLRTRTKHVSLREIAKSHDSALILRIVILGPGQNNFEA